MTFSKTVFTFLAVVVALCSSARLARDYYDDVDRGDSYVDKLLQEMISENGHNYDPYYMEDSVVGFSRKIAFVNVSGEAKFHNGYITGLRSLHRSEHCSLQEADGKLYVKADLGAGVLDFHYSGSVLFMNWGPTVTVHGTLAYVEVQMKFDVDAKTGRNGKLDEFTIDDMRGMTVWITGLGPLNWAVNPIISGLTKIFKGYVRSFLENKVMKHIAERLPNYQFPVDEIQTEPPQTEAPEVTDPPQTEAPEVTEAPQTEAPEVTEPPPTEAPEENEIPEVNEAPQSLHLESGVPISQKDDYMENKV